MELRKIIDEACGCAFAAVAASAVLATIPAEGALRAWEPSDYVQGSLELHLDGIRNAGAGLAFDSEATVWKDVSGNDRDAILHNGGSGAWLANGTGFSFAGDACFHTAVDAAFSLGTSYAIEILAQYTRNTSRNEDFVSTATGAGNVRVFYKKGDSIFHRGDDTFGSAYNNCPALPTASSKSCTYLTAVRNGSHAAVVTGTEYPATSGTVDGNKVVDWFEGAKDVAVAEDVWLIGGTGNAASPSCTFFGSIRSVRLYSKFLSEDELAWNRAIDDARYFSGPSVITATPVASAIPDAIIATSVEGLNGNETCGGYVVDEGGYEFSALFATSGDAAYVCAGYTLERWKGSTWGVPETHAGETTCFVSAGDKVRITWLWETATGVISRVDGDGMPAYGAIAVESAVKGLSGREPNGVYSVDGWTFAAGDGVRKGRGKGWICIGYQLQTWDENTSAWGTQETVTFASGESPVYVSPTGTSFVSKRLIWLWKQVQAARTAADYSPDDYASGSLELHLDGKEHGDSNDVWSDLSGNGRDASLVVYDDATGNAWNGDGFYFNAGAHFITSGSFALGHSSTIEVFADAPAWGNQPKASATLFSPDVANSGAIFYKKSNYYLSYRADNLIWSGDGTAYSKRPSIVKPNAIGHVTAVRDGCRAAIFTGTAYPENEVNESDGAQAMIGWAYGTTDVIPAASPWSVGGFNANSTYALKGTVKSVRAYDRLLAEDELVWNREVDNIRFTGQLPVTNVVVVAGGEGAVQAEAGEYKVEGEWTFTASKTVNGKGVVVDVERYMLEEFVNGSWSGKTVHDGASYTYTVGVSPAKVRLTWLARPPGVQITIR